MDCKYFVNFIGNERFERAKSYVTHRHSYVIINVLKNMKRILFKCLSMMTSLKKHIGCLPLTMFERPSFLQPYVINNGHVATISCLEFRFLKMFYNVELSCRWLSCHFVILVFFKYSLWTRLIHHRLNGIRP